MSLEPEADKDGRHVVILKVNVKWTGRGGRVGGGGFSEAGAIEGRLPYQKMFQRKGQSKVHSPIRPFLGGRINRILLPLSDTFWEAVAIEAPFLC